MGYARVQVAIPRDTTIPADNAVNTFHFETVSDVGSGFVSILLQLTSFYQAIDAFLGSTNASPAVATLYDLEDPSPRAPVDSGDIILTPGVGNSYPGEVAICLSYAGAVVSGQNQARRRGRIYLGPLDADSGTDDGLGRVRVSSAAVTAIAAAGAALADPSHPTAVWSVFSPTTAGPEPWSGAALASAFTPVTNGFVDNAFDTQRRRGASAQSRTVWTA